LDELGANEALIVTAAFANDLIVAQRFVVVPVTDGVLGSAARALTRHALRAYDAVQLASALAAREADPELIRFACFDRSLSAAAAAEGFQIIGPG